MKVPTPHELDGAPEVAVLSALEATLTVSRIALISARAELRDPESGQHILFSEDDTGMVRTLLTLMDALGEQLDVYRRRVLAKHRLVGQRRLRDI